MPPDDLAGQEVIAVEVAPHRLAWLLANQTKVIRSFHQLAVDGQLE